MQLEDKFHIEKSDEIETEAKHNKTTQRSLIQLGGPGCAKVMDDGSGGLGGMCSYLGKIDVVIFEFFLTILDGSRCIFW